MIERIGMTNEWETAMLAIQQQRLKRSIGLWGVLSIVAAIKVALIYGVVVSQREPPPTAGSVSGRLGAHSDDGD
jgi:hypothetical protein